MIPIKNRNADEILLEKLKEILLQEDRKKLEILKGSFEEQFEQLKHNFPREYEQAVNQLIEKKLKGSQEEIINLIYPVLGKMIKRFVTLQIRTFKDAVDDRIKNTFTVKTFKQRLKASLFGVEESDMIFSEIIDYQVDGAYIIEKHSGLLVGTASRETTIDKDVLAGMLTAIKSFGEDAFNTGEQDLSSISYDSFQIYLQSAHSYYIALAINGVISAVQQNELSEKILDFAENNLKKISSHTRDEQVGFMSEQLRLIFIGS